jgi:hypothetical protein
LEDMVVTISRATGTLTFPTNFMLVAAMNLCPCGYFGDPVKECPCSPSVIIRYCKRIPSTSSGQAFRSAQDMAPACCFGCLKARELWMMGGVLLDGERGWDRCQAC